MNNFCGMCGWKRNQDKDDPCLGHLPGVKFACCGHGEEPGYIAFEDGTIVNFNPICISKTEPNKDGFFGKEIKRQTF